MATYFLDTSALVKRYHTESGTTRVDDLFDASGSHRIISRLGLVETISALTLKVRTGEITLSQFTLVRQRLLADVAQRLVLVGRVLARHYQGAEPLLVRHAPTKRLRTLDAMQLAIALDLASKRRTEHFVCADRSLCEIAAAEGLSCIDPSQT